MRDTVFNEALIMKNAQKYFKASKQRKSKILNEIESQSGLHRKSIIRSLNRRLKQRSRKRGGSKPKYHVQVKGLLELIWEANDYICAERFHPSIKETVDLLEKFGYLSNFENEAIKQIREIPLGTLKVKLKGLKRPTVLTLRDKGRKELQKRVPINTKLGKATKSGYLGIDFVDHNGGDPSGKFARTLMSTDTFVQWISRVACLGKDRVAVEGATEKAQTKRPYRIRELHSDNEPNLLYVLLKNHCRDNNIAISRSRSYQKNDNSHAEQKNGDKTRGLIGYFRYDKKEQVEILNEIYEVDDLYQNHFIASQKLEGKEYNKKGKLIRRKHDEAKTPYQRVLEDKSVPVRVKIKLISLHRKLDPLDLKRKRDKLLKKLSTLR